MDCVLHVAQSFETLVQDLSGLFLSGTFDFTISNQSSSGFNVLVKSIQQPSKATLKILHHLSTFWGFRSSSEWPLNSSLTVKKQTRTETILFRPEKVMIRVGAGDLNVHLTVEFPQGRGAHRPFLFPPSAIHTHTHPCNTHTDTHTHKSGNDGENSPHLLLPHSLVSSPRFNGCAAKARLPPPMSHNYLLTAQTNRATQRVTSNQNCHRWLSLVIKAARPLPVRRVREWKEEGEKRENVIAAL